MKHVRLIRHGESAADAGAAGLDHASVTLTANEITSHVPNCSGYTLSKHPDDADWTSSSDVFRIDLDQSVPCRTYQDTRDPERMNAKLLRHGIRFMRAISWTALTH